MGKVTYKNKKSRFTSTVTEAKWTEIKNGPLGSKFVLVESASNPVSAISAKKIGKSTDHNVDKAVHIMNTMIHNVDALNEFVAGDERVSVKTAYDERIENF